MDLAEARAEAYKGRAKAVRRALENLEAARAQVYTRTRLFYFCCVALIPCVQGGTTRSVAKLEALLARAKARYFPRLHPDDVRVVERLLGEKLVARVVEAEGEADRELARYSIVSSSDSDFAAKGARVRMGVFLRRHSYPFLAQDLA